IAVRYPQQLDGLDGMVLPGGESTTQLKLLDIAGLTGPLDAFVRSGRPLLTTCAGTILAAREVHSPEQRSFGWIDITAARNAGGRQVHSFEARSAGPRAPESDNNALEIPLVFIRAPRITAVGPSVEVLATFDGEPVLVRQRNVVSATFHP